MAFPGVIRRLVLTGFMGAGKSTIGALLAEKLGWDFVDVDDIIETRAGKRVAEIFAGQGETAFRAFESKAIAEVAGHEYRVIGLGGGAVEAETTRNLLARLDRTCVVFLDAPLEILVARCLAQPHAAERPVLANREGLLKRFETRLPHYRQAHVTVSTAGLSPQETVDRVLEETAKCGAVERRKEGTSTQ